ncbi:Calcium-binding EF-hand [Sphingobium indicum BiD32]|uniref:Calcium-binding EF-hand n=1 Tax=Sphingobium indicum BiD32 TaxID=1301087 RepID=N1MRL0_9SPHN|nr:EF-hand domain-containing protein [Sphingobium indicum]CCW19374.1 Calcium-binding EF-hand [Sphingobium indicum BiD32]
MIRTLLVTTALAIAAPAMAQQAAMPEAPQSATPATPATPADPQAAMPQAATPATPATPANPTDAVASIVDTEFPAYDANSDGQLDQSEFSKWMVALKDQEMKATGKALPAEQVTAWANGAFTTADADKSVSVSKPELVTFLSGGAG